MGKHQDVPSCALQVILHKMQPIREAGETQGGPRVTGGQADNGHTQVLEALQDRQSGWPHRKKTKHPQKKNNPGDILPVLQIAGRHWHLPTYSRAKQNPPRKVQAANWVGEISQVLQSAAVRRSRCSLVLLILHHRAERHQF